MKGLEGENTSLRARLAESEARELASERERRELRAQVQESADVIRHLEREAEDRQQQHDQEKTQDRESVRARVEDKWERERADSAARIAALEKDKEEVEERCALMEEICGKHAIQLQHTQSSLQKTKELLVEQEKQLDELRAQQQRRSQAEKQQEQELQQSAHRAGDYEALIQQLQREGDGMQKELKAALRLNDRLQSEAELSELKFSEWAQAFTQADKERVELQKDLLSMQQLMEVMQLPAVASAGTHTHTHTHARTHSQDHGEGQDREAQAQAPAPALAQASAQASAQLESPPPPMALALSPLHPDHFSSLSSPALSTPKHKRAHPPAPSLRHERSHDRGLLIDSTYTHNSSGFHPALPALPLTTPPPQPSLSYSFARGTMKGLSALSPVSRSQPALDTGIINSITPSIRTYINYFYHRLRAAEGELEETR